MNESGDHAAFYLDRDDTGIWVDDRWTDQPEVHQRLIRFEGGRGSGAAARATMAGASCNSPTETNFEPAPRRYS